MTVKVIEKPAEASPVSKRADVELHFDDGPLAGLKLVGFAIWEHEGGRKATMPARRYSVDGQRRSYPLLRPIAEPTVQKALERRLLDAYDEITKSSLRTGPNWKASPRGPRPHQGR